MERHPSTRAPRPGARAGRRGRAATPPGSGCRCEAGCSPWPRSLPHVAWASNRPASACLHRHHKYSALDTTRPSTMFFPIMTMNASDALTRLHVRKRKISQEISDAIKRRILLGEFKKDSSLPPMRELAARFGVGAGSLREALRLLEDDGFLVMKSGPAGGPIVCHPSDAKLAELVGGLLQLSRTRLRDLHTARYFLELPAARFAAVHRTEKELEALEGSIMATRDAADSLTFHRHGFDFHQLIVDCTGNRILGLFFGCLTDLVYGSVVRAATDPAWRRAKADEHQRIWEAIRDRDSDRTEQCLRSHLDGFEPIYSHYLEEYIERY